MSSCFPMQIIDSIKENWKGKKNIKCLTLIDTFICYSVYKKSKLTSRINSCPRPLEFIALLDAINAAESIGKLSLSIS